MRVGHRMALAALPGILGVFTVAALAYWGQYARRAPALLVTIAGLAAVASLVVAWRVTRDIAPRLERLARGTGDEIADVEAQVHALAEAIERAHAAESRASAYGEVMEELLRSMPARLEEAQLPVHILLESPFGELNENQEELLGAARNALDAADVQIRRLRRLLALEQGAVARTPQPIGTPELLRAPLAIAAAHATRRRLGWRVELPDALPRAVVDPVLAQEALTSALQLAVDSTADEGDVSVRVHEAEHGSRIAIDIVHGHANGVSPLERRLLRLALEREGGSVMELPTSTEIVLPAEAWG